MFLPIDTKSIEVTVQFYKFFRSNSFHKNVKHCAEFTFLDGDPKYHFGFTPYKSKRLFITLDRFSENSFACVYKNDTNDGRTFTPFIENNYYKNQVFLICFDSSETKITYVLENKSESFAFTQFNNIEEWYVYVDAPYESKGPAQISINLGFEEFINQMPQGYSRWINNIDGFVKKPKSECFVLKFRIAHRFSGLIFFLCLN